MYNAVSYFFSSFRIRSRFVFGPQKPRKKRVLSHDPAVHKTKALWSGLFLAQATAPVHLCASRSIPALCAHRPRLSLRFNPHSYGYFSCSSRAQNTDVRTQLLEHSV